MKIWDISRTLSDDLAEWPGDEPFHFRLTRKIAEGKSVNLGAMGMSVHNGTHADARFHFDTNGESIEKAPLEIYLGRAAVVDLTEAFSQSKEKHLITVEDLQPHSEEIAATSRLLVRTGRWSDSTVLQRMSRRGCRKMESNCWGWICRRWTRSILNRCRITMPSPAPGSPSSNRSI